jgi:hypothetical protein
MAAGVAVVIARPQASTVMQFRGDGRRGIVGDPVTSPEAVLRMPHDSDKPSNEPASAEPPSEQPDSKQSEVPQPEPEQSGQSVPASGEASSAPATTDQPRRRSRRRRRRKPPPPGGADAAQPSSEGQENLAAKPGSGGASRDENAPARLPRMPGPGGRRPEDRHPRGERPREGGPRDAGPRRPGTQSKGRREHGPGGFKNRPHGRGHEAPTKKPEPRLASFETTVDHGFEDLVDEANDGATRRVDWTIIKRTVADQRTTKPVSAVYILRRDGVDTEFANLSAARAAVNKKIVHPEKLTRAKADYGSTKK